LSPGRQTKQDSSSIRGLRFIQFPSAPTSHMKKITHEPRRTFCWLSPAPTLLLAKFGLATFGFCLIDSAKYVGVSRALPRSISVRLGTTGPRGSARARRYPHI